MSNKTIAINSIIVAIMSVLVSCNVSEEIVSFAGHSFIFFIAFFVLMYMFVDERKDDNL